MENTEGRPEVTDTLELARRINYSTDIVTDLTDVVQEELPKKSLQGDNEEATNSAIFDALDHIHIDLTPIEDKLDEIEDKIDHIDIDTSDLAKEDTLVQGIADIRDDISNIDIDMSAIAKQGSDPDANITDISGKINQLIEIFDGVTYDSVMEELNNTDDE